MIPFRTFATAAIMAEEARKAAAEKAKQEVLPMTDPNGRPMITVPDKVEQMVREPAADLGADQSPTIMNDMRIVCLAYATGVNRPLGSTPEPAKATQRLNLTYGLTLEHILGAAQDTLQLTRDAAALIQQDFINETGNEPRTDETASDQITRVGAEEREEQSKLVAFTQLVKTGGRRLAKLFALQLPAPASPPPPPEPVRQMPFAAVLSLAEKLGLTSIEETPKPIEAPRPPASWTTEPILQQGDRDLDLLNLVLDETAIAGINLADVRLDEETGERNWLDLADPAVEAKVAAALESLELLNLDRQALTDLVVRLIDKADRQYAQSQEILATTRASREQYEDELETINELAVVAQGVIDFFTPKSK